MTTAVRLADLAEPQDEQAVVELLDHYSQHEMGCGRPLPDDVKMRLVAGLRAHPMSRVLLAYDVIARSASPSVSSVSLHSKQNR